MDGDEEQQSAAVAVCDGATGDGAEQSGDAAPSTIEEEPGAAGSAMAVPADPADPADVAPMTSRPMTPRPMTSKRRYPTRLPAKAPTSRTTAPPSSTSVTARRRSEPDAADAAAVLVGAEQVGSAPRRLGRYLRRGVIALVAVGVVALAVSAFAWVVPSLDSANRRFIEEAQSHGHAIAPGEQQMLVLSAARKVCDRKFTHETIRERRSTALTSAELAAVGAVFGPRTRDFTALALDTYCSR